VGTAVSLNTSQTITGQKQFNATPLFTANVAVYGNMLLNNLALTITQATLQKIQFLSTVSSDVQTQLNQKIGLGNNNTYTGFNDFNNAVTFNSQFYIASASPLIQIENGNTLRQWSSGTTGDTVMELAWDKGASTTGFSIQGGNDGTRGLFGLYFCTNVAAGTRIPIMYSKDTGTQANNVLTIGSGTLATTNITYSGNLNSVSSTTFGYISGLTSSAQTQLDNKANLTTTNNFTGGNTFLGQLASGYNASGTIYGSQTELFLTGHRSWANGGDPTNGSNVFEISLDTGFYKRGLAIQGGESDTNTSGVKRSIFGLYYRTFVGSGTDPIRTPIMYGTDQETGSSLDNTLTIPSSLRMTGTLKLNGGEEISNTQLGYLTTLSANVQTSINSLATKLTDLVWTAGSPNKTSIVNTTETSTLTFSNTLNGISTGVFSFLSGLTANIQDQFTSMKARTPVGSIIMYLKGDLGSPFIFCDGRELNRSSASALFAVIGTTYGAGDGSTTFNIPDMTAIFVRGFGSRTINGVAYASTTGSTLQIDAMEAHTHSSNLSGTFLKTGTTFNVPGWTNGSNRPNESSAPASTGGVNAAFRTSNETRPINLPVYYYICAS
jgi:microcystin-dependent protein